MKSVVMGLFALAMLTTQMGRADVKIVPPNMDFTQIKVASVGTIYIDKLGTELSLVKDVDGNGYIVLTDDLQYALGEGNEGAVQDAAIAWAVGEGLRLAKEGLEAGARAVQEHQEKAEKERVEKENHERETQERIEKEKADKEVMDKATSKDGQSCSKE